MKWKKRYNPWSVFNVIKAIGFSDLKEIACSVLSNTNPGSCSWPCISYNSERYKDMKNFLRERELMDIKMTEGEVKSVGFEESKAIFKATNFLFFFWSYSVKDT